LRRVDREKVQPSENGVRSDCSTRKPHFQTNRFRIPISEASLHYSFCIKPESISEYSHLRRGIVSLLRISPLIVLSLDRFMLLFSEILFPARCWKSNACTML
jgi:hypothetical protein